jgi:hypothetical protein
MLTIFSTPKPFKGHIGIIQRNAITSWTLIRPRPEIILFGSDAGTAEVARELGVRHEAEIAMNQYGTPLLNDLFLRAETHSQSQTMCYVNTDILLFSRFKLGVEQVSSQLNKFLIVSQRINIDVTERINFEADWEIRLGEQARESGTSGQHTAIDVFAFPRGTYPQIPAFGIGRLWFDQWLIKAARENGIPVVDLSPVAPVLHQNHDYGHVLGGADWIWKGEEAKHNLQLYGGVEHAWTLLDVTHELRDTGKLKRVPFRRFRFKLWKWTIHDTFPLRRRLGLRRKADLPARPRTDRVG